MTHANATVTFTTTKGQALDAAWKHYMEAPVGVATEVARNMLAYVQQRVGYSASSVMPLGEDRKKVRLTLTPAEARVLGLVD